jgi:organic hydroperoxide reductase OsmC/OhrA
MPSIPTDDVLSEQDVARHLSRRDDILAAAIAGCFLGRRLHLAGQAMASELYEYLDCVHVRMEAQQLAGADHVLRLRDSAQVLEAYHLERLEVLNRP